MLIGLSCIFPCDDMLKTAAYYKQKLGFRAVEFLDSTQPHICLYRGYTEIILTQIEGAKFVPNHTLYGYGYDAYFYTRAQRILQDEFMSNEVCIVKPLSVSDYKNNEFVIEDIDGRWIAFGLKDAPQAIVAT